MQSKRKVLAVFGWPLVAVDELDPRTALRVCERTLELWDTGAYDCLLVSGGRFLPPEIQTRPWSKIASEFFEWHGVPKERIVRESDSFDTYDNIRYSLRELYHAGIPDADITVVTHKTHGRRVRHTFKVAHGVEVRIEPVDLPLTILERIKQWAFVLYHWLDPYGTKYAKRRRIEGRRTLGLPPVSEP